MNRISLLIFSLAVVVVLQAPAFGQGRKADPRDVLKRLEPKAPSFKHLDGQILVFVANGVGGSTIASDHLRELNSDHHLGLCIQTVPWTRTLSIFEDLVDHPAQLHAAHKLGRHVEAIRKDAPNAHIFFVGHSAGTRVVLAAAEILPAKSVDRVILLHSAVSHTYDLTRALKASRHGIDNFYSSEDSVLGHAEDHGATAAGLPGPLAGRVGFQPASKEKKDLETYRAVRQYAWNADYCGNGGHFAWTLRHNMKKALVPLFFNAPPQPVVVMEKKKS